MKLHHRSAMISFPLMLAACSGNGNGNTGTLAPSSDGGVHQPYTHVASCMTALASGSPQNSHRFAVAVLQDAAKTQVTLELTPVKVAAPTLADDQIVGNLITLASISVSKIGQFDYVSPAGANIQIPGDANPISGTRIILEKLDLSGKLDTTKPSFCGRFVAKIIEPITLKGNDISAVCVFEKKAMGDAIPVLKTGDFDACTGK